MTLHTYTMESEVGPLLGLLGVFQRGHAVRISPTSSSPSAIPQCDRGPTTSVRGGERLATHDPFQKRGQQNENERLIESHELSRQKE
jgi:hypothetical protein